VLNDKQQSVVENWETRIGPNGELLCVSCHRVHDADASTALLMFEPQYGETCVTCHPAQNNLVGTSHDLRTNFPAEENVAGMTPKEHGACSACHLAHRLARTAVPTPGDPAGRCATCHQPGSCAQARKVAGGGHPDTECTRCHNPHDSRLGSFLAKPEPQLCTECHAAQAGLAGGPHDLAQNPDVWPEPALAAGGLCLPCHVGHGDKETDLLRFATPENDFYHDDVCLACHPDAAWDAQSGIAIIHPHEISPDQDKVDLALVPIDDTGNMRMGCRTCHDPHGGAEPPHLARVARDEPAESLCLHCHAEKTYIKYTGHSADSLSQSGVDTDSCRPCHAMHADRDGSWGLMLSPRFLMEGCDDAMVSGAGCVPCLACHHPDGPAPVRVVASHPEKFMLNTAPPGALGYLPLFDAAGHVNPQGGVVCRTCHLSHGRLDLLHLLASEDALSESQRTAIRLNLRSFIPPNICTQCHGQEARFRFLFFHDPERRGRLLVDPNK
jgi:predicted CXXCH cytochrome family protein